VNTFQTAVRVRRRPNGVAEHFRSRSAMACLDLGTEPFVEVDMGETSWYTVHGDGKGGAKLRMEAEYTSADAGEVRHLEEVRVDKAKELAGGKMRLHIIETRSQKITGWASAKMLICQSKICGTHPRTCTLLHDALPSDLALSPSGHCNQCKNGILPSEKARVATEAQMKLQNLTAELSDAKKKIEMYEVIRLLPVVLLLVCMKG